MSRRRSALAAVLVTAATMTVTTAPAGAAATATFASGQVIVTGDGANNNLVVSRSVAGAIRLNGGALPIAGGSPTVSNTTLILLFGQAGNDVLTLDEANGALPPAQLFGSFGNDTLTGGSRGDTILGQAGDDTAFGKGGADLLVGGSERDTLTGGDGDDQVHGEAGDDRLVWNPGDDTDLNEGGTGTDTVDVNGSGDAEQFAVGANGAGIRVDRFAPAASSIDAGTVERVDLQANGGADEFVASGDLAGLVALVVDGGDGDDTLSGANGSDLLFGGDGRDGVDANGGNDYVFLGAGTTASSGIPATARMSSRVRTATTGWPSGATAAASCSACRPTAGGCGSPAALRTSSWTSARSRASTPSPGPGPTR